MVMPGTGPPGGRLLSLGGVTTRGAGGAKIRWPPRIDVDFNLLIDTEASAYIAGSNTDRPPADDSTARKRFGNRRHGKPPPSIIGRIDECAFHGRLPGMAGNSYHRLE